MPKLEPKAVQKELEQGLLWPVYWIYGQELMKARELLKRIRKTALGDGEGTDAGLFAMSEETIDGSETPVGAILDSALTCSLGGGLKLVVVKEAHAIKEAEELQQLLGARAPKAELSAVCVFLSKDLDARKKFSKILLEKAAVVPCEEVPEAEREAWISYLAKRRGLNIPSGLVSQIAALDPWTLDIVDQELAKYELALTNTSGEAGDVLLSELGPQGGAEAFLQDFFARDMQKALERVQALAERPDESLPLLGLLAWNVRQLATLIASRANGSRGSVKLSPYLAQKLEAWARGWTLPEILALQERLAQLDFAFKQTPLLPLGMWTELVLTSAQREDVLRTSQR
jgi:DNA polymerase-3 subunit delta